jgi:hypothetical protein
MRTLSPDTSFALGEIAHTVGFLWAVYARLTTAATAPALSVDDIAQASRAAAADLAPLRERLLLVVASLPAPSTPEDEDLELRPLEFCRASVECALTDCLDPAIGALADASTAESLGSVEEARSLLECVLADDIWTAITELSIALLVDDEVLDYARPT